MKILATLLPVMMLIALAQPAEAGVLRRAWICAKFPFYAAKYCTIGVVTGIGAALLECGYQLDRHQ